MRSIDAYIQESFYNNVKTNSYKYANLDKYIVDILSDLKKTVSSGEKAYRKKYPEGKSFYTSPMYGDICSTHKELLISELKGVDVRLRISYQVEVSANRYFVEYRPEFKGWISGHIKNGEDVYETDKKGEITERDMWDVVGAVEVILEDSDFGMRTDSIKKTIRVEIV